MCVGGGGVGGGRLLLTGGGQWDPGWRSRVGRVKLRARGETGGKWVAMLDMGRLGLKRAIWKVSWSRCR